MIAGVSLTATVTIGDINMHTGQRLTFDPDHVTNTHGLDDVRQRWARSRAASALAKSNSRVSTRADGGLGVDDSSRLNLDAGLRRGGGSSSVPVCVLLVLKSVVTIFRKSIFRNSIFSNSVSKSRDSRDLFSVFLLVHLIT